MSLAMMIVPSMLNAITAWALPKATNSRGLGWAWSWPGSCVRACKHANLRDLRSRSICTLSSSFFGNASMEAHELTRLAREAALEAVEEHAPDLVLLDIDMPKMDGVEVLKRLKADEGTKNVPVIMVTALNTETQIAASLDNGAVDHIVKPYSGMIVRARVRTALRSYDALKADAGWAPSRGKVIAFIGCKGGVGTTTTALNVAIDLARKEYSTIICELRPDAGAIAAQINALTARNLGTLLEGQSGKLNREAFDDALCKHPIGLRALLAPQDAEGLIDITAEQTEAILSNLADMAEFTILDLPCTPFLSTEVALRRAEYVVLVVELEAASVTAAQRTLERLRRQGIGGISVGVVVTNRSRVSTSMNLKDVRSNLDCSLIGVIPPDPEACMLATKTESPVVISAPESGVSGAFVSLANRLLDKQVAAIQF